MSAWPVDLPPDNRQDEFPDSVAAPDVDLLRDGLKAVDDRLHVLESGGGGASGTPGVVWRGQYSSIGVYTVDELVGFRGSVYINKVPTSGNDPRNTTYWDLFVGLDDLERTYINGAFEIYPPGINANSNVTLVAGVEYYIFFQALDTQPITSVIFNVGTASTGVTTPIGRAGIYDVDTSRQPTTLLASGSLSNFGGSGFQSAYKASSILNSIPVSWTPGTYGKTYCLGLLFTGTAGTGPQIRGRNLGSGDAENGYSTVRGTLFASKHATTGLAALVASGTPAETAANLVIGSVGVQMGALFLP